MTGQKNRQVVLAHFSIRNATFVERAAAAHDAGFDGFGTRARCYVFDSKQ